MYNSVTRATYAELFKLAEAKLPQSVREATIKVAAADPLVAKVLSVRWSQA